MTELEWCKTNAPEALKGLPDDELVSMMHSAYLRFNVNSAVEVDAELPYPTYGFDLNDHNGRLDYLATMASKILQEDMALKGGYLLSNMLGNNGRSTRDVDFDIISQQAYQNFKVALKSMAEYFVKTGIADTYELNEDVTHDHTGGVVLRKGKQPILKCDVGWHDLGYGVTRQSIRIGNVKTYSVERILADKIRALLSPKRFRRSKDLYDVYCLSEHFNIDCILINKYIRKSGDNLQGLWDDFEYCEDSACKMEHAFNKLRLTNISGDRIDKPDWEKVLYRFYTIGHKVKEPYSPYVWDCVSREFK